ncbi:hypothetical protein Bca52824_038634 [Brassica carinata]|uniref:DUF4283 domain-containing protein n=1 Tax=Brassica carinata TaxID=52824 RepID=A0A8X7RPP1_BRACI|nr:hypothetical protein Bca52824_038634 [Brassica carinata]
MPSRRWDPGIGVGVCLATIWQDHITDSGNQDFYLVTLGRYLGIDKGIIGSLRKLWIGFQWRWIQINSQIESRIYIGYLTDSVILITFFIEIDPQYYQFGFFGVWLSRFCSDLKLARINLWRYGFMGEYFLTEFMENSNKYNRILFLFVLTMTQSQLLSHGEDLRNGEGTRKRLKISVVQFDNSALIKTYAKTLIGRCMNPDEQEMNALFTNLPKIWKLEEKVTGTDLGFGKFQFDVKTEEDLEGVLKHQPYHFDFWMLSLAKWQPRQSRSFPSEIMFWIKVIGIPLEFRMVPTFESIRGALGWVVAVDTVHNRVQVVVDAFKELCFETTVDFKGGEFYDGEEAAVSLRYEKLFGFCKLCGSLCHKDELCPLDVKNLKVTPERKRENREVAGVWSDGKYHDDGARSYKGVVINGNMGPPNKKRDSREYYGKGKGKMYEESDSKWVKVAERGSRRPPNHYGNYRGDRESSRYNNARRGDGRRVVQGKGAYTVHTKVSSGQVREEQRQRSLPQETREEGEIKSTETEEVNVASAGFQLELAKTQTEATEGIMEVTDVEKGLLEVQGMVEKQDALTDDVMKDIDMEMDAINANLLKNGMDMEAEDEFQTLSEEEAEQALGDQIVHTHVQEEEELGNGDGALNDDTGAGDMGTRQSSERLFKPTISTAGTVAKGGSSQGDSSKQLDNKGPSNPKPANLKF